jgi:hypothetical protein
MSDYNKVIKNDGGITKEEFMELINRTVGGDNIYLNVPNPNGDIPIAVKLKSASSQFGCLYIELPELNTNKDQ